MDGSIQKFIDLLKENDLSITGPRKEVFEALYTFGLQTMPQLIGRCRSSDRASIYRTVQVLERVGAITRVPAGFRYKLELSDTFLPHHHHITCSRCGKNQDIEQLKLEKLLLDLAASEQFTLSSHKVELTGLCANCRIS